MEMCFLSVNVVVPFCMLYSWFHPVNYSSATLEAMFLRLRVTVELYIWVLCPDYIIIQSHSESPNWLLYHSLLLGVSHLVTLPFSPTRSLPTGYLTIQSYSKSPNWLLYHSVLLEVSQLISFIEGFPADGREGLNCTRRLLCDNTAHC
jgi:hypothetical protein